jgi:hypothetical protein
MTLLASASTVGEMTCQTVILWSTVIGSGAAHYLKQPPNDHPQLLPPLI